MANMFNDPRLPARFWGKVGEVAGGCWEWQAYRTPLGYGRFNWGGRAEAAYRVSFVELVGPVPEGKELHHLCENPPCCNPDHLLPVTRWEHRQFSLLSHCENGHPMEGENLLIEGDGVRRCRTCRKQWMKGRRVLPEGKSNHELAARDECHRGHSLSGWNLIERPNGTRACRECTNRRQRERNARVRAENPLPEREPSSTCRNGHEYDAAGVYVYKGVRMCMECRREADRRRNARKLAAEG